MLISGIVRRTCACLYGFLEYKFFCEIAPLRKHARGLVDGIGELPLVFAIRARHTLQQFLDGSEPLLAPLRDRNMSLSQMRGNATRCIPFLNPQVAASLPQLGASLHHNSSHFHYLLCVCNDFLLNSLPLFLDELFYTV